MCPSTPYTTIACRLDWFNSLLYGVPENLLRKVQSVQNAAARLFTNTRRRDHVAPVLRQLHWLPVERCVESKIAYLAYVNSTDVPSTRLWAWSSSSPLTLLQNTRCSTYTYHSRRQKFCCRRTVCVSVWNSLPATIKQITSCGQFRRHLKTQGVEIAAHCNSCLLYAIQILLLTYLLTLAHTWRVLE